jgi:S-DNA-T family DNA segregation ATPase FtsK/SpoIIIE
VLNTVGAAVLLSAVAAVGLLLATNFSFVSAYERVAAAVSNPTGAFRKTLERFNAWRAERRAQALARAEARREALAAREAEAQALAAQSVTVEEELYPQTVTVKRGSKNAVDSPAASAIKRSAAATEGEEKRTREDDVRARLAQAEAELASIALNPAAPPSISGKSSDAGSSKAEPADALRARAARRVSIESDSAAAPPQKFRETARPVAPDVTDMMSTAAVVRTELVEGEEETPFERERVLPIARGTKKRIEVEAVTSMLDYKYPPVEFLNEAPPRREQADAELLEIAKRVAEKCKEFNVTGQIKHICPGPVVTTYEFKPDPGVKYSRVTGLVDDLCIALEAESIRIDRLPGKPHVGIEVPNPERETIFLREVLESRQFRESESKLTLALGKTIDGINYTQTSRACRTFSSRALRARASPSAQLARRLRALQGAARRGEVHHD